MIIEGYAALFGLPDQAGDVVRAGAFRAGLADLGGELPMLVEHDARCVAGAWVESFEDGRGLFLRGEIRADAKGGARARRLVERGVDGLSIGFIPLVARRTPSGRVLDEIQLLEVSIVAHPMQPQARLTLAREFVRAV
ncbi:MAG: HK97 family phage prohead protease [Hyphomonadaceae bacterium]|nr:HK97 family phage prohead protease [Hyphomonadaceae bacterium]